jgi:hypothetical protein
VGCLFVADLLIEFLRSSPLTAAKGALLGAGIGVLF